MEKQSLREPHVEVGRGQGVYIYNRYEFSTLQQKYEVQYHSTWFGGVVDAETKKAKKRSEIKPKNVVVKFNS